MRRFASLLLLVVTATLAVAADGDRETLTAAAQNEETTDAASTFDMPIIAVAEVPFAALEQHIRSKFPNVDDIYLKRLYELYREACRAEGVSLVVALAQMTHETDYLRFTGVVRPIQYNYAGLGSTSPQNPGLSFQTMRVGVYAHVQHLKAYATEGPLATPLVDPRFRYVRRGSAPTVSGLAGRWAADPDYARKLLAHIAVLLANAAGS